MGCRIGVEVWVNRGYHGYLAQRRCGDTGVDGNEIRCEKCSNVRPWYICPHGNDVSEWQCDRCEAES